MNDLDIKSVLNKPITDISNNKLDLSDIIDIEKKNPSNEDIDFAPLSDEDITYVGSKDATLYEAGRRIQADENIDVLELSKELKILDQDTINKYNSISDSKQKEIQLTQYTLYLMQKAIDVYVKIQLRNIKKEVKDSIPKELGNYYFDQNNKIFHYNPEEDSYSGDEDKDLKEAYKLSLHLTPLIELVKDETFKKKVKKNIDKRYTRHLDRVNFVINKFQKPSKDNKNSYAKDVSYLPGNINLIIPDINPQDAKSLIIAMSVYSNTMELNKANCSFLYFVNMNAVGCMALNKDIQSKTGELYINSLKEFFLSLNK